jgi:hypothetical protein
MGSLGGHIRGQALCGAVTMERTISSNTVYLCPLVLTKMMGCWMQISMKSELQRNKLLILLGMGLPGKASGGIALILGYLWQLCLPTQSLSNS